MEITVLEAIRIFQERFPNTVSRSTFYSLRPREVKISSPHDTCMCVYHENMNLALKVCMFLHILSYQNYFYLSNNLVKCTAGME